MGAAAGLAVKIGDIDESEAAVVGGRGSNGQRAHQPVGCRCRGGVDVDRVKLRDRVRSLR